MKEIMLFQAGKGHFGLCLSTVKGVYRAGEIPEYPSPEPPRGKAVPGAEKKTIRLCSLPEGPEMLLYDFPLIFGGNSETSPWQKVIRVDVGKIPLAILADHIDRVLESPSDRIIPLPRVFGEKSGKWFPRILKQIVSEKEKRLIPILDPAGMAGIVRDCLDTASEGRCDPEDFLSACIRPDMLENRIIRAIQNGVTRAFNREIFQITELRKMVK